MPTNKLYNTLRGWHLLLDLGIVKGAGEMKRLATIRSVASWERWLESRWEETHRRANRAPPPKAGYCWWSLKKEREGRGSAQYMWMYVHTYVYTLWLNLWFKVRGYHVPNSIFINGIIIWKGPCLYICWVDHDLHSPAIAVDVCSCEISASTSRIQTGKRHSCFPNSEFSILHMIISYFQMLLLTSTSARKIAQGIDKCFIVMKSWGLEVAEQFSARNWHIHKEQHMTTKSICQSLRSTTHVIIVCKRCPTRNSSAISQSTLKWINC